jgi:alpha-L-rhamnosidase
LSWLLPPAAREQYAYRLTVADGDDTGWVPGRGSVLVPWPFASLGSAERVTVQVAVRTDVGESPWSESLSVETGLLSAADWVSSWVSPFEEDGAPAGQRPAYELRGHVTVDRPVARARLYATAHGLYEVFIGGVRVGDLELTPGFTQYGKRLQVQAYDVTDLLSSLTGSFAEVTVLLSDGWWRGQVGMLRSSDQWGTRPRSSASSASGTPTAARTWPAPGRPGRAGRPTCSPRT